MTTIVTRRIPVFNDFRARTVVAGLLALGGLGLGCDRRTPSAPTQPDSPAAPSAPPSITAIAPNLGFTVGGTFAKITGTGFQSGVTVTFGGATVQGRFDHRDPIGTIIYLETPAHTAELVDVIVTNRGGQPARLTGGYTYASPETYDFNGTWEGGAQTGHTAFRFTIQNHTLITAVCDTATLTVSPAPSVRNGGIAFAGDQGVTMSGKFVSPTEAVGLINFGPCAASDWYATKQ
jgi:hypothetical protein